MKVRAMTIKDCEKVAAIELASFSMPWSTDSFVSCVLQENYRSILLTSEDDSEILGYAIFNYVLDEAEILNVCVKEEFRGQGLGLQLMKTVLSEASKLKLHSLFLEVRISNEPAKALYRKMGFKDLNVRKNFYEFPTEDAIVMQCIL